MAAEITATNSDCPVLKFAPGSAIGNTQHDNRQRKQGDKILLNAEQIRILGGKFTPAQQQRETDQTAGDDHNNGVERITHQGRRGVAGGH